MSDIKVTVRENGPLLVSGAAGLKIEDHEGNAFSTAGKETIALCRCGASANKPFCDGQHKQIEFTACDKAR